MSKDKWIERRALYLSSKGPDMYPFGYFKYLATLEWEEEHESA